MNGADSCLTKRAVLAGVLAIFIASCSKQIVNERDRDIFLRAADFAEYGFVFANPAPFEKFEKLRYFDGSFELNYEFDPPESENQIVITYLQVTATVERSLKDARMSQGAEAVGSRIGFKYAKVTLDEKKDFVPFGEKSAFYVLMKEGQPIGNYYTARKGVRIYSITLLGLYFGETDEQDWQQLVMPKLEKFSSYKP